MKLKDEEGYSVHVSVYELLYHGLISKWKDYTWLLVAQLIFFVEPVEI